MTTTKTASKKSFWNEENTATAIEIYKAALENGGAEVANVDGLAEIMSTLNAPSITAVRSKLVSAKVYEKSDKPRKVGGGSSLRKAHYVRAFAKVAAENGLIENPDDLASLELPKMEALEVLAKMLNIEVKAE